MPLADPKSELELSSHVLDIVSDIVAGGGFDTLTLELLAERAGTSVEALVAVFGSLQELLVLTLNREFTGIYLSMVDDIDRDPNGGKLSRIYYYALAAVYERPLARVLYTIDREAMNSIMRSANGFGYIPGVGVRGDFIEAMQRVGMVRRDVDAIAVSHMLTVFSAGLALTAPHEDLDRIIRGVADLLVQVVDEDVADTTPGKAAFFEWAMSL